MAIVGEPPKKKIEPRAVEEEDLAYLNPCVVSWLREREADKPKEA